LPPTKQKGQLNPGLSSQLDEKRGSRQRSSAVKVFSAERRRLRLQCGDLM
jgi:hypothetical protein